ncbi:ATP-binding protein [bacterium]|nr:ATP-binding protein [bacterium]
MLEIKLSNKVKDFLLFIDEIENSFYPKQQEKITTFLIDLSKELSHRNINHQFFIATHSPFVIKNFLNHNNTRIVDVEKNGENIEISNEILLDKNKLSYDEINYLYYGIVTTNYYLSLFEKLKVKICEKIKKDDMNCAEIDS